ncbi:MAG: BatD family protein [Marinilabiliales bacterium]|nr:BatD family protein [Marinilabiliales bacterium]
MSIINGKMTQNYELRYTYILEATKEGEYAIPAAEVTVDKKKYTSNTLTIEVIKGSGQSSQSRQNPANVQQEQVDESTEPVSGSDLFLKVLVSKTKTYREEHLIATVKLYSKLNLTNLGEYRPPAFDGVYSREN